MMMAGSMAANAALEPWSTACPQAYEIPDWETFFERDPDGVIPLVRRAGARETLMKCSVLVVDSLFTRKNDSDRHQAFLRLVHEVIGPDSDDPNRFRKSKRDLITVFRHIKRDRIARANADLRQQEVMGGAEADHGSQTSPAPRARSRASAKRKSPAAEFCEVFADVVRERLDTARAGLTRKEQEVVRAPVPFLLSEDFADHFCRVIVADIAPTVAARAKTIIRPAKDLPPENRAAYFKDQIDEARNRHLLWEAWQVAWREATGLQEIPAKPKPRTLRPLDFLKKKPDTPFWRKEMTLEEWSEKVRDIRAANRKAKAVLARICAPAETYDPPTEEDGQFLMEMFGRSPKAIGEQMNALYQIAVQGGDVGRTFDLFRRGKHPDLALLACCYRYPATFLDDRKTVLKRMLSGYMPVNLPKLMPYTVRSFGDRLD